MFFDRYFSAQKHIINQRYPWRVNFRRGWPPRSSEQKQPSENDVRQTSRAYLRIGTRNVWKLVRCAQSCPDNKVHEKPSRRYKKRGGWQSTKEALEEVEWRRDLFDRKDVQTHCQQNAS